MIAENTGVKKVTSVGKGWIRLSALSLMIAGICFVLYPAIRPFSDESSLQGAEAFASSAWILAHSLAMIGFILLSLGLLGICIRLQGTRSVNMGNAALVVTWIGIGLVLPYYGAEAFALHAVGQEALTLNNTGLLVMLTGAIRYGPGIWIFLSGLLAIAAGTILFSIAIRRSGAMVWWSGIPLALGFILFLPQFFFSQPVRVAHGVLILAGCWLLAWSIQKQETPGK